jgi:CBS domain containing-hemolysin-like protein
MSDLAAVGLTIVLLAGNAFFVGAEFALISARRTQIEPRAEAGSRWAKITLGAMENVSVMMACAQLGITACSLGLGAIGEPAIAHLLEIPFEAAGVPEALLHPIAFAVALTLVVFLHMVLGEMVPKNIAIAGPERSAIILAPPLVAIVKVVKPLIIFMNLLANGILRLFKVEPRDEVASTFNREEMAGLIAESRREGLLDDDEHELLSGAFALDDKTVSSVAMPIDSLVVVDVGASGSDVEGICADTGYSRFPVRGPEGLVGYLHLKDVLETENEKRERPIAQKWIRSLANVSPTDSLRTAIGVMQQRGAHMARVVEADGSVVGIVALEDLLEELVGEVVDATQAASN